MALAAAANVTSRVPSSSPPAAPPAAAAAPELCPAFPLLRCLASSRCSFHIASSCKAAATKKKEKLFIIKHTHQIQTDTHPETHAATKSMGILLNLKTHRHTRHTRQTRHTRHAHAHFIKASVDEIGYSSSGTSFSTRGRAREQDRTALNCSRGRGRSTRLHVFYSLSRLLQPLCCSEVGRCFHAHEIEVLLFNYAAAPVFHCHLVDTGRSTQVHARALARAILLGIFFRVPSLDRVFFFFSFPFFFLFSFLFSSVLFSPFVIL